MEQTTFTLSEASQLTGKNRTTIYRWIKRGKLSATLVDGDYRVDASELHRVSPFDVARNDAETLQRNERHQQKIDDATVAKIEELATLRAENRLLREMTEDYRRRLDTETVERMRLTRLLEHTGEKNASMTVTDASESIKTEDVVQDEQIKTKKRGFGRFFWFK